MMPRMPKERPPPRFTKNGKQSWRYVAPFSMSIVSSSQPLIILLKAFFFNA